MTQELVEYVADYFKWITYGGNERLIDLLLNKLNKPKFKKRVKLYPHSKISTQIEELNLEVLENYKSRPDVGVGYEGRCEDIFPLCSSI